MLKLKNALNALSYLQYPLMIAGLVFMYKPLFTDISTIWIGFDKGLILTGVAVSLSTLQDTKKTQNKLSLKIYQSPRKSRIFLIMIALLVFLFLTLGTAGYFLTKENVLKELSTGLIVFGIGILGLLKAAMEMAENHRLPNQK